MDRADDVIEKIKKCLRLAGKTTEAGERDAAMGMARRLADANGIALETVEAGEGAGNARNVTDERPEAVRGPEVGHACNILRTHFGVVLMFIHADGRRGRVCRLSWFGTRLNIDIARHVYHILLRESRRAWNEKRRTHLEAVREVAAKYGLLPSSMFKTRLDRGAFLAGFFYAIDQKLRECPLRNDREAYEAERKEAEDAFERFKEGNEVGEKRNRGKAKDRESIIEGIRSGSAVNLARPCEDMSRAATALPVRAGA